MPSISNVSGQSKRKAKAKANVPEGIWKQCPRCDAVLYKKSLDENYDVCPKCDHHLRISARRRIQLFMDADGQEELCADLEPVDLLKFKDLKKYKDRIVAAQKRTGEKDALVVVRGRVKATPVIVAAFEFGFIGGSMGAVVGEKFNQAVNTCIAEKLPLVCFATSGGARMQEALISLMQMPKTSAALERLKQHSLPYISVLIDPVYGGVSASLDMLGDIQRSEFLLEHGAIDMIVHRRDMRAKISSLLEKLMHCQRSGS